VFAMQAAQLVGSLPVSLEVLDLEMSTPILVPTFSALAQCQCCSLPLSDLVLHTRFGLSRLAAIVGAKHKHIATVSRSCVMCTVHYTLPSLIDLCAGSYVCVPATAPSAADRGGHHPFRR